MAGRVGVEPAAELRHVQRPTHGLHVQGALRACPASSLHSWALPAHCLRRGHPTPSSLPTPMLPLFLCTPLDSAGRVDVQPAAELRHLQRHNHDVHVSGALRACPASSIHSWDLPAHCLRHRVSTPHTPATWPACLPSSYAPLSTRQNAWAFNQPLSFDTSSVSTMNTMFNVRSAHAPGRSSLHSWALPARCVPLLRSAHALPSPGPHVCPPTYAPLSTRQHARAFNQPLSFDTSSVTNMGSMFAVRSARALPATTTVGPF